MAKKDKCQLKKCVANPIASKQVTNAQVLRMSNILRMISRE